MTDQQSKNFVRMLALVTLAKEQNEERKKSGIKTTTTEDMELLHLVGRLMTYIGKVALTNPDINSKEFADKMWETTLSELRTTLDEEGV